MSNGLGGDTYTTKYVIGPLTLGTKITQSIVKYPLRDMTYDPAKLEAASLNGYGGHAYTRKKSLTLPLGHETLPSTLYIM